MLQLQHKTRPELEEEEEEQAADVSPEATGDATTTIKQGDDPRPAAQAANNANDAKVHTGSRIATQLQSHSEQPGDFQPVAPYVAPAPENKALSVPETSGERPALRSAQQNESHADINDSQIRRWRVDSNILQSLDPVQQMAVRLAPVAPPHELDNVVRLVGLAGTDSMNREIEKERAKLALERQTG